jgi:hypothetical protein
LAVVASEVVGDGEVFVWGGFGFFVNERFEVADWVLAKEVGEEGRVGEAQPD